MHPSPGTGPASMPYSTAFPEALGTGIIINTSKPVGSELRAGLGQLIEDYESSLSRFRDDSVLADMARAKRGGNFRFPEYCQGLFDLYDCLYLATGGALDPAVGADLARLGYGRDMTFRLSADAADRLGRIRGRSTWGDDVERDGVTLRTRGTVQLDFGALGKGYLVDLLADVLNRTDDAEGVGDYLIDAGGDMRIQAPGAVSIAMEDPDDLTRAVGVIRMTTGSLGASAPSRRKWTVPRGGDEEEGLMALHHILNAVDGMPVRRVKATWVVVGQEDRSGNQGQKLGDPRDNRLAKLYPTALADGLSTALFLVGPNGLAERFPFACARLDDSRHAVVSKGFPGTLFVG